MNKKAMKELKYTVRSAQEAVSKIREQLGENAQVLSVKTVSPRGFLGFLKKPLIEVVAQAGLAPGGAPGAAQLAPATPTEAYLQAAPGLFLKNASGASPGAFLVERLEHMGLPEPVLLLLRSQPDWPKWEQLSFSQAFLQIQDALNAFFKKRPQAGLGPRVAFVGAPGVGKTTLACKWLTRQVFRHLERPTVLKVDGPRAQGDEALRRFADLMDVPFLHSWEEGLRGGPLLVDTQGVSTNKEAYALRQQLEALQVPTRVLVLHRCYAFDALQSAYALGKELAATHCAFSHADSDSSIFKLWPFLLSGDLSAAFFSKDANPAGPLYTDFSGLWSAIEVS